MDPSQTPPSTASRAYSRRLTSDHQLRVKTLANEGHSRRKISERLTITFAKVRNSLKANDLTPLKYPGRNPVLSTTQIDEIEAFVCSSSETHQMSFELAHQVFPHFGVREKVIAREMKKMGYSLRVASPKSALSQENRRKRYEFYQDHLDWTKEQWMKVL